MMMMSKLLLKVEKLLQRRELLLPFKTNAVTRSRAAATLLHKQHRRVSHFSEAQRPHSHRLNCGY